MASELLQEWGKNWEDKLINPTVREVVRDVIGQFPAESIPSNRQKIATLIDQELRKKVNQLSKINGKPSVEVIGVQLRNIFLPERIMQKIEQVQMAKQEAEKMKFVVLKAEREQQVQKIQAETEKIKKVIQAQAKAEAKLTQAKAQAKAILLQANATAKANKVIAQSITPQLLKWKQLEVQESVGKEFAKSLQNVKNLMMFMNPKETLKAFNWWIPLPNQKAGSPNLSESESGNK